MMNADVKVSDREVIGIVITHGHQVRVEPRLTMYVWSDAPDADTDATTKAA